ncbi:exonuclease domain-containing protein [Carboxylicivirga caseinilyticus]|uniref:exonuclease domain-containing protein n=1 Tax=Carboxylicivirga caseinilyticus TaxID=3417572 RepID=UPI003D336C2A|nr:hypothetical protein [Marinilabiliaceae bacterium A049]
MKYFALDVETANTYYSSICQIGIAEFEDGEIINRWSTLINPECYFDPINVSIHNITEEDVKDAPTFTKIYNYLSERLNNHIIIHHMPFDKIAINQACEEYQLPLINIKWLDSAKIVRRTWEQFAYKGFGLKNVANFLEIDFKHHDALQDAIAAGSIVAHACSKKNMTPEDWIIQTQKPISSQSISYSSSIKQEGNPEGALYGENLVFTGTLSLPRKEASNLAAGIGCNVSNNVTSKTSMLVVGIQDSFKLAGYTKSSKQRKVEALIEKGNQIKILTEKDFIKMCEDEGFNAN